MKHEKTVVGSVPVLVPFHLLEGVAKLRALHVAIAGEVLLF